jgi:UDP-N-acetylglucosamine 2-epimerase
MRAVLRVVRTAELTPTILFPNTDRGHAGILAAIGEFTNHARRNGRAPVVRQSLPRETFLLELAGSDVLIGNSSCGIIEAPVLGVPSVNIGPRQEGRERAAATVSDADESEESIRRALARALRSRPISSRSSVYGHGGAGKRIANILASVTLDNRLHRKATVF